MPHTTDKGDVFLYQKALSIIKEIEKTVIGKGMVIRKVLAAILAQGHVLLEDNPGVGKTTLALAISRTMELEYKRIQFTPEVMPADIVGFSVYNKDTGRLEYQSGAAVCNLLLVDEINRGSTKTQSALLQVMEEGCITLDGETQNLPEPYIVIATQNPAGSAGTQLLPESQMDRFMIRLSMGYPELEEEVVILKKKKNDFINSVNKVVDAQNIIQMQKQVEGVHVNEDIYFYIAGLAAATRKNPLTHLGVSTRGSVALLRMSQALAWLSGRDYVIPADVQSVIADVFEHRLVLNSKARVNHATTGSLLVDIMNEVPVPEISRKKVRV